MMAVAEQRAWSLPLWSAVWSLQLITLYNFASPFFTPTSNKTELAASWAFAVVGQHCALRMSSNFTKNKIYSRGSGKDIIIGGLTALAIGTQAGLLAERVSQFFGAPPVAQVIARIVFRTVSTPTLGGFIGIVLMRGHIF